MLVYRRPFRIEWGHCDAAGIVFFPNYFAMFDGNTHLLFEAAGWKKKDMLREFQILGTPLVDARCSFRVPSSYGDDVILESQIGEFKRSSFTVTHKLWRVENGAEVLGVEGLEARVWAINDPENPGRLKTQPIPDIVRARLSASA
jgi:4-hydroxybenzoyl-CoA thioesterase